MSDSTQTTIAQIAPVIDRATTDSAYRQQLLSSPAATLEAAGIAIPSGMQISALENSSTNVHIVVPSQPSDVSDATVESAGTTAAASSDVADQLAALGLLFVNSWTDSSLRSTLLQSSASALAARGISTGVSLTTVEATDSASYLVVPAATTSSTLSSANISSITSYIETNFSSVATLITAGSYAAGYAFAAASILQFKSHKDNPTQIPIGTPIALIFVGAALLFLPTILSTAGTTS